MSNHRMSAVGLLAPWVPTGSSRADCVVSEVGMYFVSTEQISTACYSMADTWGLIIGWSISLKAPYSPPKLIHIITSLDIH